MMSGSTVIHLLLCCMLRRPGGRLFRVLSADDTSMDNAQQTKPVVQPPPDLDVFIDTTPGAYEWVYGDTVSFKLRTSKAVDPANIRWRVTNGHCVKNPCTGENDCHFHEISLDEKSRSGYEGARLAGRQANRYACEAGRRVRQTFS